MESARPFELDLIEQHFCEPLPERDPSQAGRLRVVINGVVVMDGADDDTGVARSALALSRTLVRDHTPEAQVADKLIIHDCGLASVPESSCPIGANWWVRHEDDVVLIDGVVRFPTTNEQHAQPLPSASVVVPAETYVAEITRLGEAVLAFAAGAHKVFEDDFDQWDWLTWQSELRENLAAARTRL